MEEMIQVGMVSKAYNKRTVIDHVSLSIPKGEIYGMIGPSGAGKTTLVKMMVGMESADSGEVFVLGRKMPSLLATAEIGYMAQADSLYGELTGEENLRFFASLFGMRRDKQKERIQYALELVHLQDEKKKRVNCYSGGMKRRLSLAIALVSDPKLLILDEPTVGIDPELRVEIWNELFRLKKEEGKTIVITTHVMDEAEKCDHLAMVREGVILTDGTPSELMRRYDATRLEAVFLLAGGVAR